MPPSPPHTTPPCQVPYDEDSAGDFLGMVSRKNVQALLDAAGKGAEAVDLSSKIEVRSSVWWW
jgi:hypothetical protein